MPRFKLAPLLLVLTLMAAAALRISGIAAKKTLSHDEGYSYICATGHVAEYHHALDGNYPLGEWAPASEWKKFLQLEQRFCFKKIGRDLANKDVHPPLYFWLLHAWSVLFGINMWTGPSLNLVLNLLAILALYFFARDVLRNALEAAVVACAWALSPAVFQISFETRQYELLALLTILFVWRLVKFSDLKAPFPPLEFFLLAAVVAAGALTYYYFAILVAGGCLFAMARLARANTKRLLQLLGALVAGYAAFFLLHPYFYRSFTTAGRMQGDFSQENLMARVETVFHSLRSFFINPLACKPAGYILLAAFLIWLVLAWRRHGLKLFQPLQKPDLSGGQILFFFFWIAGILSALYLTYVSPSHAMNPKYLTMAWPFFAFMPVFILRLFKSHLIPLAVFSCLAMALSGIQGLKAFNDYVATKSDPATTLAKARAIVLNNLSMGYLPRVVWKAADDQLIFAMPTNGLLDRQELWLNRLDSTTVLVCIDNPNLTRRGVQRGEEKLHALIAGNFEHEWITGGAWGLGDVIKIRRKLPNNLCSYKP